MVVATFAALSAVASSLSAQTVVTPNLSTTVPSQFYTDRYAPTIFGLANGVHGRNDVLQLLAGTNLADRAPAFQSSFYNTQGMKMDVNTSGSWMFTSDLFVDASWANSANGYVRTDMWATATDDAAFNSPSNYPIVGFTNYGGPARFRGYDVNTGGWLDFANTVNFNSWNSLGMGFDITNNTFSYFVNGALAGSVVGVNAATGVADVMYQSYNFNDPALELSRNPNALVSWSNTPPATTVPEPSTYALMAFGLAGVFFARRKRQNSVALIA